MKGTETTAEEYLELFAPDGGPFMSFPCDLQTLHDAESGTELHPHETPDWISRRIGDGSMSGRPSGRRVAVVDSGMLPSHSWIKASLDPDGVADFTGEGWEDTNGHGTVTALLTLAASTEPLTLLSAKIVGRDGRAKPDNLIRALQWCATQKVDWVVLSAGVQRRSWGRDVDCDGSCRVCKAASAVLDRGVLITAAGGNRSGLLACPATLARVGHANIIAAGPVDAEGRGSTYIAGVVVPYVFHGALVYNTTMPSPAMLQAYGLETTNPPEAAAAYEAIVQQGNDDEAVHALCRIGELHERIGAASAALDAYRRAVVRGHTNSSPLAGIRLGNVHEAAGDHNAAVAAFEDVAATGHRVFAPMALLNLGNGERRAGNPGAAEIAFRRAGAFTGTPSGASAMKNLGVLLWQAGRFDDARQAFRTVLDWGPGRESPGVALNLGMMEKQLGHLESAEEWLMKAIATGDDERASRAALEFGDLLATQRAPSRARAYYEIAAQRGSEVTREQASEALRGLDDS